MEAMCHQFHGACLGDKSGGVDRDVASNMSGRGSCILKKTSEQDGND